MLDMIIERHGQKPDRELLLLILAEQLLINEKLDKMSDVLQKLQDAQAKAIALEETAITLLTGQKATIDDLNTKLADAIAANDPTAIQAVSDALNAESDKLNAAIAAIQPPVPSSDQPAA
jgi:hypothetical protein